MAGSVYEALMTKNKVLAKFFDDNEMAAKLVMKLVRMIVDIAIANRVSAEEMNYEVYAPRGGEAIVIRLRHPNKSITV